MTKSCRDYGSYEHDIGFRFHVPIQDVNFVSRFGNSNCTDVVSSDSIGIFFYKQNFKTWFRENMIGIQTNFEKLYQWK